MSTYKNVNSKKLTGNLYLVYGFPVNGFTYCSGIFSNRPACLNCYDF